ncbi:CUB domain-containing protein 1-like [Silurus meridionalis]|nr:CUB domain-containing protein 1-like [Silurus meridionalis]
MSWLVFGLLLVLTAGVSEANAVTVTTGPYTKVTISRLTEGPDCFVCVGEGSAQTCKLRADINQLQTLHVSFNCSRPQDIFTIEINRDFDCSMSCNYGPIQADWSFFQDFKRVFTWDLRFKSSTRSFQLEFPGPGMRQIQSSEQCPDNHTYSILMYLRAGPMNLGKFCQNGTITRIQILWKWRLTLEVPKETTLSQFSFKYSEVVGSVFAVDAVLPRGISNTDFFSASGFPFAYTVMWNFVVPPRHNFTVDFVKYNKPECQGKPVKVIYQQANMAPVEKTPTDEQPANYNRNFSLSLTNCDGKTAGGSSDSGLLLNFRVSVFRGGIPDLCAVDLQNDKGLSLQIEKKNQAELCEIGMDKVVKEKIVVPAGSKVSLSFLDCLKDDLILTATKTIECQNLASCPSVAGTLLTIPLVDSCLPPSLSQVTWVLNVPERGSVELSAPQGSLYQSVPGDQVCDQLLSAQVSAANNFSIGDFCSASKGIIQRIQISSSITVTTSADGNKDLRQVMAPLLNASFNSEIDETLIYTVYPRISTSALIMTPNWPGEMKPDSTLSYIVNVPEDYSAQLLFSNVTFPECLKNHAEVHIQELGSDLEVGFREDEKLVLEHNILKSFYLNMSNCEPEKGIFAILSKISLQKKPGKLLSIILGVVGALLALLIIILVVVCVAVRKKKRQINRSSIYIPKGNVSLPGDVLFPKTRADNDSHVYTSIDDTMVYGHLLQQDLSGPGHFNGHQVDGYKAFSGPVDKTIKDTLYDPTVERGPDKDTYHPFLAPSETFIPSRPRTPLGRLDSMDYEDRRMVDNTLYTFKTPGEPNQMNRSAADPVFLPEPDDNSWSESELADPEYEATYEEDM